jgi:miniconductance mechanosensitive channel
MTLMVHYLQPTENGLPLEIIFFTREKDAYSFEKLQCELYEHLFAVMPEFELAVFQI